MMAASVHAELADEVARYYADPLGFVRFAFPWGEVGSSLEHEPGPDKWQAEFLAALGTEVRARRFNGRDPVDPIRMAVASGHGIGKTTITAWLILWLMSTRPGCRGRVTANTYTQLEITTWAELQHWLGMLICRDWFDISKSKLWAKCDPEGWFVVPVTCSEENSEAFAGQHNKTSTSFYLFDESSLIPDKIWDVADGGLVDGEPMHFAFGNATRNTGRFHDVCFGPRAHRWQSRSIDSRTCRLPNHVEQQHWIDDYGLDSDYVRVRVLGLPPMTAETQLIGRATVEGAQQRQVEPLPEEPLLAGVDVPDGGSAWFVIRFRRGPDARPTCPSDIRRRPTFVPAPIRFAGSAIDRSTMVQHCATVLADMRPGRRVAAMFIDHGFGAPIVERLRALGHNNVHEVNFGGRSPDKRWANMRAYMWAGQMREWLDKGCIDRNDTELAGDLMAPGFHFRAGGDGSLVVESKDDMRARGIRDLDDADALALTWGAPVAAIDPDPTPDEDEVAFGRFGGGMPGGGWMAH